jgi:hypothetical protein
VAGSLAIGTFLIFLLNLIFNRKETIAYLKGEWYYMESTRIDVKFDFWLRPIRYRMNPKALEVSMKRQHKALKG